MRDQQSKHSSRMAANKRGEDLRYRLSLFFAVVSLTSTVQATTQFTSHRVHLIIEEDSTRPDANDGK